MSFLWVLFAVLLILWLLGFVAFHIAGALIHVVLLVALVVFVIALVQSLMGRPRL